MYRVGDLQIFGEIGSLLSRPRHAFVSWHGLGKRLRVGDDKPRRAVCRLEAAFGGPLVDGQTGRLALTPAGRRVYDQVRRLLTLSASLVDADSTEPLTVEMDPGVAGWIVPAILPAFLAAFAEKVQLRISPLDMRVGANVTTGITSFGLGIECADAFPSESLNTGAAWHLLVPPSHRFLELDPGEMPQLGTVDRMILIEGVPVNESDEIIQHAPERIWCPDFITVQKLVASGLGIGIVPEFLLDRNVHSIRLAAMPLVRLGLYLPRDVEALSDPARILLQAIRDFITCAASKAPDHAEAESDELSTESSESVRKEEVEA
jgi:DNA-binding transcriptional LysR family regulator